MEIKILCSCGTKYKFDVEPVDGRMPHTIACPRCGADATEFANLHIQQSLDTAASQSSATQAGAAGSSTGVSRSMPDAAPANPAPKLRIRDHTPASAPPPPSAVVEPARQPMPAVAAPATVATSRRPVAVPRPITPLPQPGGQGMGRFGMGVLGALAGNVVGLLAYYGVAAVSGKQIKLLALGVGYLAGFGAQWLSKKEGSKELGSLTCLIVIVGLFFAQYTLGKSDLDSLVDDVVAGMDAAYDREVAEARDVVAKIPNGTDQEIRVYLAQEMSFEDDIVKPSDIESEDVSYYREELLPRYRDLANGTFTREAYEKELDLEAAKNTVEGLQETSGYKMVLLAKSLTWFNIVCLIGAAGIAWRMSANA